MESKNKTVCYFGIILALVGFARFCNAAKNKTCYIAPKPPDSKGGMSPSLERYESALLMILAFGGFSIMLAILYKLLRKFVFQDADNLDTTFDAGGNVSLSLTAVTVASQLLWPADLLQSSTVTVKSGIAAPFWYTVGAVVNMLLFPILSVRFKSIAPGAKTFLQLMYARHGTAAHIWYCFLSLLLNFVIVVCLLVSGRATIQALTKDSSDEFVCLITAVLFGSYSFVGGLGTTFYVSYFNALLIAIILTVIIFSSLFSPAAKAIGLGDVQEMYDVLACLTGPEDNYDRSFLTFRSVDSLMWGLIGICLTSSLCYCDQASWQSRIAAKPSDGVIGFIIATAIWFSIPSALGTTAGMAYLVMSNQNGTHLLTEEEINIGLVTPLVTEKLFGKAGAFLILTLNTMALMSTGSGEVMAASSIIVYDIYTIHINPFRPDIEEGNCKFCEKPTSLPNKKDDTINSDMEVCACPPATKCVQCKEDVSRLFDYPNGIQYKCTLHADMRHYQDKLIRYKSWCIIWLTILIIPIGLVVLGANLNLNWVLLYGVMISVNGFPGVLLSVLWAKTTKFGVITGSVVSLTTTIIINLGMASRLKEEGGLSNFFNTSVNLMSVFVSGTVSLALNFIILISSSLYLHRKTDSSTLAKVWKVTHDIDNPLHPWSDKFRADIPGLKRKQRPTVDDIIGLSRKATKQAYIGSGILLCLFIIIIPIIMVSFPVLSFVQFHGWIIFCVIWAFGMAAVAIIMAPIQEVMQIVNRMRINRKRKGSMVFDQNKRIRRQSMMQSHL